MRSTVAVALALLALATSACRERDRSATDSGSSGPRTAGSDSTTFGDTSGTSGFEPDEPGKVQVMIACANGAVRAHVKPWKVREPAGTQVRWKVIAGSTVDSIVVAQQGTGPWVLSGKPPFRGDPNSPAVGGSLAAVGTADSSAYRLSFWCGDVHGVIDPDIIVLM